MRTKKLMLSTLFFRQLAFLALVVAPTFARAGAAETYSEIYSELMSSIDIASSSRQTQNSFNPHFQDSLNDFPFPDELLPAGVRPGPIHGTIDHTFLRVRKPYSYELTRNEDLMTIRVRVHFANANARQLAIMRDHFDYAEQKWQTPFLMAYMIPTGWHLSFEFLVVDNADSADFSISLVGHHIPIPGNLYDSFWRSTISADSVTHEIGHMMGLADEYDPITGAYNCLPSSIMCSSPDSFSGGSPQPHHYYHILRRAIRQPGRS